MNEIISMIHKHAESIWRFRWLALAAAWFLAGAWWLLISIQSDVYEASARVYVDTSSELRQLLRDQIVDTSIEDQLAFVRQAMLGRAQLREVAKKVGMIDESDSEDSMESIARSLGNQIRISGGVPGRQGEERNLYTISFRHESRTLAISVVDTVLDQFVETSLSDKRSSSQAASEFLRSQISEYEGRMQKAEERLADFKRRNIDRLPSMQGGYFERLQSAIDELNASEQELRLANSRLEQIQARLSGNSLQTPSSQETLPGGIDSRIQDQLSRLEELRLRYTDQHPDVMATREILRDLREQRAEMVATMDAESFEGAGDNPVRQALVISRNEVEANVATLSADVAEQRSNVERLRALIDEMPKVEAELAQLNRDYDVIHAHYQSLLNSLERDQLTRDVFQSEQIDFRIIDPPGAGFEPVSPPRLELLVLGLVGSIAGGVAVAVGLGLMFPVFGSASEIKDRFSSANVIGTVGRMSLVGGNASSLSHYFGPVAVAVVLVVTYVAISALELSGGGLRNIL